MDLSKDELEAAKAYMKAPDDDELVVTACVQGVRAYMKEAGVSLPASGTPRRAEYDLVCHSMALSIYDRRALTAKEAFNENPVMRGIFNQLKRTEPMSNSDIEEVGG